MRPIHSIPVRINPCPLTPVAHVIRFSYSFDVLHHAIRALAVSVKVSIRIDSEGVMSLQFLMPSGATPERKTWMEFRVSGIVSCITLKPYGCPVFGKRR